MKNMKMFYVFPVFILLLCWYLINARYQDYLPVSIFWISVICILSIIAYQIIKINENSSQYLLILFEILTFSLIIRTIPIPAVAFYGYDPYHEYATAMEISKNGWSLLVPYLELSFIYPYPMLHFLAIIYSEIGGITLLEVARWMPIVLSIPTTLILYLFAKKMFRSERVGLLTAFGFSMLYQSNIFQSSFVRESIAFVTFVVTIYSYYIAIHLRRMKYLPLAFISSFVCVLSHHLTPFLLVVFFILAYVSQKLARTRATVQGYESSLLRKILQFLHTKRTYFATAFLLILIIFLSSYWLYLEHSPIQMISEIVKSAYFISGGKAAIILSLRYWITLGGEIAFAFIFGLLSLYGISLRGNKRTSLDLTFLAWVIFMGMLAVGFALGRIYPQGSVAVARRFQSFAYPFLFMLSGYVAHQKLKKNGLAKRLGMVLVFIFVMFSLLQLFSIPMYLYSDYKGSDEVRNILLPEEYNSILWFNSSGRVATDWNILGHAIVCFHITQLDLTVDVVEEDIARIREYKYLIVRTVGPSSLTKETLLQFDTSSWLSEIYNNGVVKMYRIEHAR